MFVSIPQIIEILTPASCSKLVAFRMLGLELSVIPCYVPGELRTFYLLQTQKFSFLAAGCSWERTCINPSLAIPNLWGVPGDTLCYLYSLF